MKYETATALIAFFGMASAMPRFQRREVPQEHSHEKFLTSVRASLALNNPAGIADPVFGLLGDAAATGNCGTITDLECCHQATADQAFSNAKAAGDVTAMTDALVFAAIERNTGGVGVASVLCTSITATNPEIAALTQHQDPASSGATEGNKAITLELAKQIASIGGDPQTALESGTFAAGDTSDSTGRGNACDDTDDAEGCIFTQNLLVEDATPAEISAAVAGVAASTEAVTAAATDAAATTEAADAAVTTAAAAVATADSDTDACPAVVTSTVTVDAANAAATTEAAATTTAAAASSTSTTAVASGTDVNVFTGTLGSDPVPVIQSTGDRPFEVNGSTFVNAAAAIQRACAVQNNACANAVNSQQLEGSTVSDCNAQEDDCNTVNGN
ncbi:hypothetical protein BJ878DRAFT_333317 [Calycina marina]|uniref:Uncharacterized protein n=1 Tax=Calycina marina TaxID=1763456 RepID=A0A9P7Z557_9HELO|nr:hypothetical protein BJ878DRAFT_333317 [Calycina marina]